MVSLQSAGLLRHVRRGGEGRDGVGLQERQESMMKEEKMCWSRSYQLCVIFFVIDESVVLCAYNPGIGRISGGKKREIKKACWER